jgi:hypothetical protein
MASTPQTDGESPQLYGRPLRLPTIGDSQLCPVSRNSPDNKDPHIPSLLGSNPVFVVGEARIVDFDSETWPQDNGWFYLKALWLSRSTYQGPALIRGRQLNGTAELRFGEGSDSLLFPSGDTGVHSGFSGQWRELPAHLRFAQPGCYALQVDGLDFTEVIVFEIDSLGVALDQPVPTDML